MFSDHDLRCVVNVKRKYLLDFGADGILFSLDESYKPIMKLHQTALPRFEYTMDGDQAKLVLSRLKSGSDDCLLT